MQQLSNIKRYLSFWSNDSDENTCGRIEGRTSACKVILSVHRKKKCFRFQAITSFFISLTDNPASQAIGEANNGIHLKITQHIQEDLAIEKGKKARKNKEEKIILRAQIRFFTSSCVNERGWFFYFVPPDISWFVSPTPVLPLKDPKLFYFIPKIVTKDNEKRS